MNIHFSCRLRGSRERWQLGGRSGREAIQGLAARGRLRFGRLLKTHPIPSHPFNGIEGRERERKEEKEICMTALQDGWMDGWSHQLYV